MSNSTTVRSGGISVFGLIFVGLFFAKIFGIQPVTDWSWWWVTAPLWGGFVFLILLILFFIIVVPLVILGLAKIFTR